MRQKPKKEKRKAQRPSVRYESHPIYGKIPLKPREYIDRSGKTRVVYRYDPEYQPGLPRGAVRADIRKQNLCQWHHVPKYFYVDEERTCVQCGARFVFGAAEQKYWYESLGFYGTSVAIRCPRCRRARRTEKAWSAQIAAAKSALRTNARDAVALISLAEAIVRYHQQTSHGDLEEAISAARKAHKIVPAAPEPLFWEALAQMASGRTSKSRGLLHVFLSSPEGSKRSRGLAEEAKRQLLAIDAPPGG